MTYPFVVRQQAVLMNRGHGYAAAGITGTMAAALAADSLVFAMFCDPQAGVAIPDNQLRVYLDRLRLAFTTIAAFTTPITAGRRLGVYRAAAVAPTGGAALVAAKKDTSAPASVVTDIRIATTVALTPGAIVREANPIALLDLTAFGSAGGRVEAIYELATPSTVPESLRAGEMLVVSNPTAMDAAGTWQLAVTAEWYEQARSV